MNTIGFPLSRIDGKAKVTGKATYTAEFQIPETAYAVMVQSTIPAGHIESIDTSGANSQKGVLAVMTLFTVQKPPDPQKRLSLLQDSEVHYNNQPIAVVVADTLEQAQHAAELLRVNYRPSTPHLDFNAGFANAHAGTHHGEPGDLGFGNVTRGLASEADVVVDQVYTTPIQHHNPIEPHATIAHWNGDHLIVYDTTQNISGHQKTLAGIFAVPEENVRVITRFVGGAFGCKGEVWSHTVLAAMAAKQVNRPVKLVLERPQMFGPVGSRPRTHQRIVLGATREGKLTAIWHEVHAHTSFLEDYLESAAFPTRVMYACPNVSTSSRLVSLNLGTPTYMRAPGVATGTYALEVAMDELAYSLNMDPLQLRLVNYAEADPQTKLPFSGKHLRDCYTQAAEQFGWSKRNGHPRSMQDGRWLIGWGMATETYPANSRPAQALVRIKPDGRVLVATGTHEIGGGTYTILAQVAAEALEMSPDEIDVVIGDTNLPEAPISADSMTTASVTPAVYQAALQVRTRMRNNTPPFEATAKVEPNPTLKKHFSPHSFGAVFAEVACDPALGIVRVRRVVAVYDVGRLINQKTAKSQFIGGIVWGISLALYETTHVDRQTGRILNANLAEYHVPVNADIGEIHVSALDVPDTHVNMLGARGIGEIGITGIGAAVANAVFHATGKRVRDLPITPDKLLERA